MRLGAGYHQAKRSTHVHHNGKETVPGAADSVRWLSQHLLRPDVLAEASFSKQDNLMVCCFWFILLIICILKQNSSKGKLMKIEPLPSSSPDQQTFLPTSEVSFPNFCVHKHVPSFRITHSCLPYSPFFFLLFSLNLLEIIPYLSPVSGSSVILHHNHRPGTQAPSGLLWQKVLQAASLPAFCAYSSFCLPGCFLK